MRATSLRAVLNTPNRSPTLVTCIHTRKIHTHSSDASTLVRCRHTRQIFTNTRVHTCCCKRLLVTVTQMLQQVRSRKGAGLGCAEIDFGYMYCVCFSTYRCHVSEHPGAVGLNGLKVVGSEEEIDHLPCTTSCVTTTTLTPTHPP